MKQLVILLLSMLSFSAVAQEPSYRPFIEEGKVWHYEGSNPDSPPEYRQTWMKNYWLEGDTVISTYQCTKLYVTSTGTIEKNERYYCGALFEYGANVFFIFAGSDKPSLLYDFSCQKGDDVIIWNRALMIQERFLVQLNGSAYVVLKWSPKECEVYQSLWIEGIGDSNGFLEYIDSWNPGSYSYKLLSCEVKGRVVFDYQTFQNTVTGSQSLRDTRGSSFSPYNSPYFDLTGRRLAAPPKRGMFIEGGKIRVKSVE